MAFTLPFARVAGRHLGFEGDDALRGGIGRQAEDAGRVQEAQHAGNVLRQAGEHRLWDSQWTNVVNHGNCYRDYSKEDAVAMAVRLTEQGMAKNMTQGWPPAPPSPAKED